MVKTVTIYTDGASSPNTTHKKGGWGAYLICGSIKKKLSGTVKNTTNQRMELQACIEALKIVKQSRPVILYSDSKYVINGITNWVYNWRLHNWKTIEGKEVVNQDLWKELFILAKSRTVDWRWVKGHSGNKGNDIADQLAVDAKKCVI